MLVFIIGLIFLLIFICLSLPLTFVVDYKEDGQSKIKVRLIFFELFKEKKKKKSKKQKRKRDASPTKTKQVKSGLSIQSSKKSSSESKTSETTKRNINGKNIPKIDLKLIKVLFKELANPFKKLVKKIKITELNINSTVGGSDAAMTALNFGLHNAAVYSGIAWFKSITSVKVESVNICPDFIREDSVLNLHFKASIKIGTVLVCVIAFFMKVIKLNQKNDKAIPLSINNRKAN